MPIYEYKCEKCGAHVEKMQKVSDAPLTVCEACGVHDILTKSFGTNNPVTLVKATINAMAKLRTREQVWTNMYEVRVAK